jgi:hypothetical protein
MKRSVPLLARWGLHHIEDCHVAGMRWWRKWRLCLRAARKQQMRALYLPPGRAARR